MIGLPLCYYYGLGKYSPYVYIYIYGQRCILYYIILSYLIFSYIVLYIFLYYILYYIILYYIILNK